MASKSARCGYCDIHYPWDKSVCPICDRPTYEFAGEDYDPDWKEKVVAHQNRWQLGSPLPDITEGKIVKFQGNYFVADQLLRKYGYLEIDVDSVVLIGGKYYEVNGRINDAEAPGWWIEEVNPATEFIKVPTLSVHEYSKLQEGRIRGWDETTDTTRSPELPGFDSA